MARGIRSEFQEFIDPLAADGQPNAMDVLNGVRGRFGMCNYGNEAEREASFGYQMLLARGLVSKEEAEDKFVQDFLTRVIGARGRAHAGPAPQLPRQHPPLARQASGHGRLRTRRAYRLRDGLHAR